MANTTTDATPTAIYSQIADGSTYTDYARIPNNSAAMFKVFLTAHRTDVVGENDGWEFTGIVSRDANAASTAIDALQINPMGLTSWNVSLAADTTNGGIGITVTGEAGKTIKWVAMCQIFRCAS